MVYQKPVIVLVGSAAQAIQGTKPFGGYSDMTPTKRQTVAAYEADE